MNIYVKLTLLCVFLVIVTSSVLYYFANISIQKTFRQELLTNLNHQSTEAIHTVERFIFIRLNELKITASNPYFNTDSTTQFLNHKLKELKNVNNLFQGISFYNEHFIKIADSKELGIGEKHSKVDYWSQLSSDHVAINVSESASSNQVLMHFETRTRYDSNGVLVATTDMDELYKVLANLTIGADLRKLSVSLLNEEGIVLYSNNSSSLIQHRTFENFEQIKELPVSENQVTFMETETDLLFLAKQKNEMDAKTGNWFLLVSISKEDAFYPLEDIQLQLQMIILLVLGGAILLALVVANTFVRPIIRLSEAAEHLEDEDFGHDFDIRSNDEVGKLAKRLTAASKTLLERLNDQKTLVKTLEEQKNEIAYQKIQLEQVNSQIADSITYARRIQHSILPQIDVVEQLVSGAFVMYEPKDVVSGDFYWFERVRIGRAEYLIAACADCTGHGVPGAILSIMGSNQMTNIVYYQNYIDPVKILSRLDKVIKLEIQRDAISGSRDGIEIGLCVINLDNLKMEFAGAGIPLYLKRKEATELEFIKSPRYMVGGMEGDEKKVSSLLKKEEINLQKGDRIYMASDGFQDQFGGPNDKKYMARHFRNLLLDLSGSPMKEQKANLENTFSSWKGKFPQTDDVVVVGIEI